VKFYVLTLFPEMIKGFIGESILARAIAAGTLSVEVRNIRDYALDRHQVVDDYPYGGGAGMVMKPDIAVSAMEDCSDGEQPYRVLMTPQGRPFSQQVARELAGKRSVLLFCGHYEGVDERVSGFMDDQISIGDYVLTGGELAAAVVLDATARLLPGVIRDESSVNESFQGGLLEGPQYTRPRLFRGLPVPEVLVSGDHEKVRQWRRREALRRTLESRPDILGKAPLTREDLALIRDIHRKK